MRGVVGGVGLFQPGGRLFSDVWVCPVSHDDVMVVLCSPKGCSRTRVRCCRRWCFLGHGWFNVFCRLFVVFVATNLRSFCGGGLWYCRSGGECSLSGCCLSVFV